MKTLPPPELVRDLPDGYEPSLVLEDIARPAQDGPAKIAEIAVTRTRLRHATDLEKGALLTRLSALCERWDLQQSLDAAREAAALPSADHAAFERLGEVAERAGQFLTASESLARAAEFAPQAEAVPLLLRSAVFAARAGRFGETERLLLQARALRGNDSLTFELLGELAGAMSDAGRSPSGAASYLLAAELSRSNGEHDKELFSLRRAYALDRQNAEVAVRIAELLTAAGQPEVADIIGGACGAWCLEMMNQRRSPMQNAKAARREEACPMRQNILMHSIIGKTDASTSLSVGLRPPWVTTR